jgi:hypothetical protein
MSAGHSLIVFISYGPILGQVTDLPHTPRTSRISAISDSHKWARLPRRGGCGDRRGLRTFLYCFISYF